MSMTQPADRQRGRRGETHARSFFEDLGWGVIETGDHDLGTDLIINIRDEERRDLAVWAGAQVKTGDSWFNEPGVVEGQGAGGTARAVRDMRTTGATRRCRTSSCSSPRI